MDELLQTPNHRLSGELPLAQNPLGFAGALREKAGAAWKTGFRPRLNALRGWLERNRLSPALFLSVAAAVGAAAVIGTVYTPSYSVSVDGAVLGVVEDPAIYDQAAASVEARAARILGYDYQLEHEVTYTRALSLRDAQFVTAGQIEAYLFNEIGEIMKGYTLSMDGVALASADDQAALEQLLDAVAAPYVTENTVSYRFAVPMTIKSDYITSESNLDLDSVFTMLTANTTGETTYEVVKGDTYSEIAQANDMSLDELMELNPQASLDSLFIGDILNVKKIIPYLSVYTVDNETYTEPIESPIEYVDDASLYIGDYRVITQGTDGLARVNADVTYLNGYESERTILETVTLEEPTVTVMAQGTTERPRTASTGTYQWPVYGTITSRFGNRSIFGSYSFHSGIDILASYGQAICASDGGLVTQAGWSGGYGNLVVITHDNGTQTCYGHNSSLAVSVGERVYQGQVIAYAGSTGRSTGVHCHFEVRVGGTAVNPFNYLG